MDELTIGFDSPEVSAQVHAAFDLMQAAIAALQSFAQAIVNAFEQIVEHAAVIVARVARFYWREIHPVLVRYHLIPIARSTMMQRKLRAHMRFMAQRN